MFKKGTSLSIKFYVVSSLVWRVKCGRVIFSHTTGSHAKPNHAAWPLLITDYLNERTNLKEYIHNRTNKLVQKNNLKTAVTQRLSTNKSPHNKQEMEKTIFWKKLQKNRTRWGNGEQQQEKWEIS